MDASEWTEAEWTAFNARQAANRAADTKRAAVRRELARRLARGGDGTIEMYLALDDQLLAETARLAGVA